MISAILTVDMIYDFRVSNAQIFGLDDPDGIKLAFDYYYTILNSKFMSLKVGTAALSILYSSHLSLTAANIINDQNPAKFDRKFPLRRRFLWIYIVYLSMTAIYLLLILPRYIPFSETANSVLYGKNVVFDETIFKDWIVMSSLRVVLFGGNVTVVAMSINVLRKCVRSLTS